MRRRRDSVVKIMKKPRAYLNVLKLRLNLALKREAVFNYPIEAYLEPTSFCNLRCPACPTGLRLGDRPVASVDEKLFKAAVDEIGDYVFVLWMYNWGEPLLHKQTPELIRYAKEKELKIILSSNLSIRLTDDYIERLVRSGLDTLIVSLDGITEETYSKYRINGNLGLLRENMRRIRDTKERLGASTPHVVWQFLVFRHNEHEIDAARAVYREWGADSINVAPAEMPAEPYDEGFEPSTLPQYNLYHTDNALMRATEKQMGSGRGCSWLYGSFVLNPNGKVSPCCGVSAERNDFGDYRAGGDFFKVWNGEKFRAARRLLASFGKSEEGLSAEQKREIGKRIDGMGMRTNNSLADTELICQQCPIPFRQDDISNRILDITYTLAHTLAHEPSLLKKGYCILAYLLMGAPHWRTLLKLALRKLSRREPLSEATT